MEEQEARLEQRKKKRRVNGCSSSDSVRGKKNSMLLLRRTCLVAVQQQQQQSFLRARASSLLRVARTIATALPERSMPPLPSRSDGEAIKMSTPTTAAPTPPAPAPPAAPPSYLHRTVFRRPLNPPAVAFSSPEGRALFQRALASGTAEGFFPLVEQFSTQDEPAYCGLASLAMVLNALNVDPRRPWKVIMDSASSTPYMEKEKEREREREERQRERSAHKQKKKTMKKKTRNF